jgi:hypothetical protein
MLEGSQGALLSAGVIAMEEGHLDKALGLLAAVTALPNAQFRAWAHFFLGVVVQTKANHLKEEAAARKEVLTGCIWHARRQQNPLAAPPARVLWLPECARVVPPQQPPTCAARVVARQCLSSCLRPHHSLSVHMQMLLGGFRV